MFGHLHKSSRFLVPFAQFNFAQVLYQQNDSSNRLYKLCIMPFAHLQQKGIHRPKSSTAKGTK